MAHEGLAQAATASSSLPSPSPSPSAPVQKGVEFSDRLIVLGEDPRTSPHTIPPPPPYDYRPYADTLASDSNASPVARPRAHNYASYLAAHTYTSHPHIPPAEAVVRPPGKRRARFLLNDSLHHSGAVADEDDAEATSCTDSETSATRNSASPLSPTTYASSGRQVPSDEHFAESTRINTKLNSMPSGGAFSFMNSSEDVLSDSSSSDDEDLRLSRKMIRVDGSAKLSSASGLGEEDLFGDDDEFGIEDAEKVEEEEAIQVRSFGRSFARVSLNNGGKDMIIRDPRRSRQGHSDGAGGCAAEWKESVEYDGADKKEPNAPDRKAENSANTEDSYGDFFSCKSAPPRRRSKIRITFNRRSSTASAARRSAGAKATPGATVGSEQDAETESVLYDSDTEFAGISCFGGTRKTTLLSRQRPKMSASAPRQTSSHSNVSASGSPGVSAKQARKQDSKVTSSQMVAVPDMHEVVTGRSGKSKGQRKMVKNVSLQRDDWIDFATNAASRQKHPWLVRLISSHGQQQPSRASARRNSTSAPESDEGRRRKVYLTRGRTNRSFWKWWSRK